MKTQKEKVLLPKHEYGRLDLRAVINKNSIVVIEMQMSNTCNMEKRAMYYDG